MTPVVSSAQGDSAVRTFPEVLRWRARRHPDLEAVRDDHRSLTYAELDAGSSALANGLQGGGVRSGDRVAILARNSVTQIELLFALAKLGAVATPVNWRLQAREVEVIVADATASLLLADEEFRAATAGVRAEVLGLDELPREQGPDPRRDEPNGVLWQLYTSGTAGTPKGALLTHANVFANMPNTALEAPEMTEGARSLLVMPLYHIAGSGWAAVCFWTGTTVVVEGDVIPERLLRILTTERITTTLLVPAVLLFLAQLPAAAQSDFSALKRIFYGASPINPELLSRSLALFGCEFTQLYGLTETTGAITALRHEHHAGERLLSCGRPTLGTDLRIVDAESRELPPGEVGEVIVRSAQNMLGYFNRDEETAEVLRDGWFHTGDAGTLDSEGFLYLRDRVKDLIVSGGENVYPIEVEAVIAEHPGVADVAVIGVPDVRWGETVKAVVVRRPGAAFDEAELVEFCRARLAGFKRPTSVDFVDLIPRNPTGKILKRVLREPYWVGRARQVSGSG